MTVDDSLENQTTRLPQEAPRRLSNERLEVRPPMHALQDQEDAGEAGPDEMVPASTSHPFGAAAAGRRSRTSGPTDQIGAVSQGWGNLPDPKKLLERTRSLVFGHDSDSDSDSDASGPSHDAITSVLLRMEFLSDWEYTIFVLCIFFGEAPRGARRSFSI